MTVSNFDKRLLIEQIRYMEAQQSLDCAAQEELADHSSHKDFEQRLWQRAQCLVEQHDLSAAVSRATRLARYAKVAAWVVAAVLGMLGIIYAITDSDTINIYWLLLLLLGFNFISMLLWLTGITLKMDGLAAGVLARLTVLLPGYLDKKNAATNKVSTQADRAWLACHFTGEVGKWQFSKITHQLWAIYLLAGLIFLVLLLMLRQYDFVWGTTLLSDSAFVKLTEILNGPLQAAGFATPSIEQVEQTRIGVTQVLSAEHRYHWAQFLLGSLLFFGIMPRLLLWLWCALMSTYARRHFALDFYQSYYIYLRQQLMPLASHGQVIDADSSPPVMSKTPALSPVPHPLPSETQWVSVELDGSISWPPQSISAAHDLGQVIDRDSQERIVQNLQTHEYPIIAVAVSSARAPDRGVQRTIASLMSYSEQRWLVLLQKGESEIISNARLAAWYRLAESCLVPADHVISLRVD